jgi:hypothetical protein
VVSGVFFDAFFSFVPAWIMALVASIIMGIALLASVPAARNLVDKRIAAGAPQLDAEGFEIASPV